MIPILASIRGMEQKLSVGFSRIEYMFDAASETGSTSSMVGALDVPALRSLVAGLAALGRDVSDAERVDQIRVLEEIKAAAAAGQARATADLDTSQRRAQAAAGLPTERRGAGVAAQVALARRESPHRGRQSLGLAKTLVHEMPHALRAMEEGWLNEWRATLLARETACLSREHRQLVDAELAGRRDRLETMSDRRLVAEAKRLAYQLDSTAAVRRAAKAAADRTVTSRPAPDTMMYLTALLPVAQGVAAYAALLKTADQARAAGDGRTRGQVMADTLVERLTGQTHAKDVSFEVEVVITDRALFRGDDEPAFLPGHGYLPAALVRSWLRPCEATEASVWLRRLYADPTTGELVDMDTRRREFTGKLRQFTVFRDQWCRTPWCGAPIRHLDHPQRHADGGPTSRRNSQGLCEHCNYAKEAPGWAARPRPGPRHTVETTTPTGHRYRSTTPAQPGWNPSGSTAPDRAATRMETHFRDTILEVHLAG
jgi:hypothetical protein